MAGQRKYRVQVFRDVAGSWRYRLRAPNGKIMQSAEAYATPATAKRGANKFASILVVPCVVEVLDGYW